MQRIKDIIQSGLQDLDSQRKKNRVSLILIFLALVVYVGVNSYANSLSNSMNASINFFESRIVIGSVEESQLDKKIELLKNMYGDDERVREIVACTPARGVDWIDAIDILYTDTAVLELFGCYEAIFDYDYKGEKRLPNEDEIIMPRYLCEMGIYDTKNLGDGDALIGKTIKLRYEIFNGRVSEEYELKVIGTYDNIKARTSGSLGIVSFEMLNDMQDMKNDLEEKLENEYIGEIEGEVGENGDYEFNRQAYYSIYVKEGYDVEEFMYEVEQATDNEVVFARYKILGSDIEGYFEYVILIGNIISVMLLLVAVINIIISSISEVKDRKWEFALKMSMGYTRRDIIGIFFVEKLANMIKALLLSLFVIVLYCLAATFITNNYLEYWKREYIYTLNLENVIIALVLVVFAGLIGTLVARVSINDIKVAETLKAGE